MGRDLLRLTLSRLPICVCRIDICELIESSIGVICVCATPSGLRLVVQRRHAGGDALRGGGEQHLLGGRAERTIAESASIV